MLQTPMTFNEKSKVISVLERYEYDAYGNCYVMDASYNPRTKSSYGNPFYFTGRELDFLDSGSLKIMYYRNRFYDTYTGRFTTHDPLGITPNIQSDNIFNPIIQYADGLSLYEYVNSRPTIGLDPEGLLGGMPDHLPQDGSTDANDFIAPSLSPRGDFKCCENVAEGIKLANSSMSTNPNCIEWFKAHGGSTGEVYIVVRSYWWKIGCLRGAYMFTIPGFNEIGVCKRSCCDMDERVAALLLIHEVAHHYCPLFIGREACADSASSACVGGI